MNVTITESAHAGLDASIVGEVDADNCSQVGAALLESGATGQAMTVDVSGLTFLDSSGISELLRVRDVVVGGGGSFVLREPTESVRRVLEITGLLDTFGLA